jgi:hypothetical protein
MNHLREAAQQALEAMEKTHTQPGCEQWQAERKASVALRAALEQPEQEPVAWTARELQLIDGMIEVQLHHAAQCDAIANRTMAERQKGWDMERVALLRKIKSNPPRREWQSLSEEEVASCWAKGFEACKDQTVGDLRMHIARAVEAALKEKNQ